MNDHERRRKLNRVELIASQTNTRLADILSAIRDGMTGQPGVHSYDGIPGTGAMKTRPVDADEHGAAEHVPVTAVEDAAIWQTDTAAADLVRFDKALVLAHEAVETLLSIGRAWLPRTRTDGERAVHIVGDGDPGCELCARAGRWNPPFTKEPSTVVGNLPRPYLLCEWHWRFARATGRNASEPETKSYCEGRPVKLPA